MITSKYIDIQNIGGKWVSLVQCCALCPVYTAHNTLAEALECVTDFAERYQEYIR